MTKLAQFPGLIILTLILLATADMTNTSWAATARVSAAGNHTLALKADGTLWSWGDNTFGQVGDGSQISRNAPFRIGADNAWTNIAAGYYHSVALKADGSLWAWGDNTKGQSGDGATSASRTFPARIGTGTNWTTIAAGDFHTLALKADGTLWAWGDNSSGQAGTGTVVPGTLTVPVQIGTATDWTAIAAGGSHSFALKTDHTLWGWGSNGVGQLGNGAVIDANAPVQIKPPPPFINTDWSAVAAGRAQSAAIKQDGTLWSWGDNSVVRPLNIVLYVNVPTRQTGGAADWAAVSVADSHTLGRGSDGTLWSWGENANGQLGHGNNFDAAVPGKIGIDTDWVGAAAGSAHSVALKADGTVWCWGENSFGQLGDGTISPKNAPTQPVVFQITAPVPATGVSISPSQPNPHKAGSAVAFTAAGQGSAGYDYRFWLYNGSSWTMVQDYGNGSSWTLSAFTPVGTYVIAVDVRTAATVDRDAVAYLGYDITGGPATGVTISPDSPNPYTVAGTAVAFTAAGQGSANYDYRFWLFDGVSWVMVQNYGNGAVWTMPASTPVGSYVVAVDVRTSSAVDRDTVAYLDFDVTTAPATGVNVAPSQSSPHPQGTAVDFVASGQGSANYDYRFWFFDGAIWTQVLDYGNGTTWTMPASTSAGDYLIAVDVRTSPVVYRDAVIYFPYTVQ